MTDACLQLNTAATGLAQASGRGGEEDIVNCSRGLADSHQLVCQKGSALAAATTEAAAREQLTGCLGTLSAACKRLLQSGLFLF